MADVKVDAEDPGEDPDTGNPPAPAGLDPVQNPTEFWIEVELRLEAGYSQAEIGRDLDMDPRRIGEFARKLQKAKTKAKLEDPEYQEDPGRMKEQYGKATRLLIPVEQRVKVLLELLQDDKSEVRLRALEMIDEVSEIGSDAAVAPALVPLFALPAGTKVSMTPLAPAPAPEAWDAVVGA